MEVLESEGNGQWGTLQNWPLIPLHMRVPPNGKARSFGTDETKLQGASFVAGVFDPLQDVHDTLPNTPLTNSPCSRTALDVVPGMVPILRNTTRKSGIGRASAEAPRRLLSTGASSVRRIRTLICHAAQGGEPPTIVNAAERTSKSENFCTETSVRLAPNDTADNGSTADPVETPNPKTSPAHSTALPWPGQPASGKKPSQTQAPFSMTDGPAAMPNTLSSNLTRTDCPGKASRRAHAGPAAPC